MDVYNLSKVDSTIEGVIGPLRSVEGEKHNRRCKSSALIPLLKAARLRNAEQQDYGERDNVTLAVAVVPPILGTGRNRPLADLKPATRGGGLERQEGCKC
jgi:hypothetical protein